MVSVSDAGEMRHNGTMPGFLYHIAEDIQPDDVLLHPRSVMECGKEWITNRELRVVLVGLTQVERDEQLAAVELGAFNLKPLPYSNLAIS